MKLHEEYIDLLISGKQRMHFELQKRDSDTEDNYFVEFSWEGINYFFCLEYYLTYVRYGTFEGSNEHVFTSYDKKIIEKEHWKEKLENGKHEIVAYKWISLQPRKTKIVLDPFKNIDKSLDKDNRFILKVKKFEDGMHIYLKDTHKTDMFLVSIYDFSVTNRQKILKWLECDSLFGFWRTYHKYLDLEDKKLARFIEWND